MWFLYFFLFSSLVLGSFTIGPFSIRVYCTVLMLLFLLSKKGAKNKTGYQIKLQFLYIFALYLVFTAIALGLNGEIIVSGFPKSLLAAYLNAFVTFWAIDYYITTTKEIKGLLFFLVAVILADGVISFFQFVGHPIGNAVAFLVTTSQELESELGDDGIAMSYILGEGLPTGFFGRSFINANMTACLGILAFGTMSFSSNRIIKNFYLFIIPFLLFACFITQGRLPFFMFLLFVFLLFFKTPSNKTYKVLLLIVVIFVGLSQIPNLLESGSFGRIANMDAVESDSRISIWQNALGFILEHPLLGGPYSFRQKFDVAPHNYFLSAFINSGLVGGIIAIYLYLRSILEAANAFFFNKSLLVNSIAASLLIFSANSLFHNSSIMTGETLFFTLYPLMHKSLLLSKDSNRLIHDSSGHIKKGNNYVLHNIDSEKD